MVYRRTERVDEQLQDKRNRILQAVRQESMRSTSSPPRVAFLGRLRRGEVVWTTVWFAGGHPVESMLEQPIGRPSSSGRRGPGMEARFAAWRCRGSRPLPLTLSDRSPTTHDPRSDLRRHAVRTLTQKLAIRDIMPN